MEKISSDTLVFKLSDSEDPDAKRLRDKGARQLRKMGYTVKCETIGFSDLARCTLYTYEARKTLL